MQQDDSAYPAAVRPIRHDTLICTPADGLLAGEVSITAPDGRDIPAYRAAPAASGAPVVLLIHEIYGLHEWIRDVARRLAHLGYFTVAPELFARQPGARTASESRQVQAIAAQASDAQVLGDLDAALTWAGAHGGDATRVGVTGFCWGGRITWLYTAHQRRVNAAVAWYGPLAGEVTASRPRHPLDVAGAIGGRGFGLYGAQDTLIPIEQVEHMRAALRRAGDTESRIALYPASGHAFYGDYRDAYRRDDAIDGWSKLQAWFGQKLAAR